MHDGGLMNPVSNLHAATTTDRDEGQTASSADAATDAASGRPVLFEPIGSRMIVQGVSSQLRQVILHGSRRRRRCMRTFRGDAWHAVPSATQVGRAGGPGTGKAHSLRAVLTLARAQGLRCQLAAPTARAAKRMEEATGLPSGTLHRVLEIRPGGKAGRDAAPASASCQKRHRLARRTT
jgi:hypothetical protein